MSTSLSRLDAFQVQMNTFTASLEGYIQSLSTSVTTKTILVNTLSKLEGTTLTADVGISGLFIVGGSALFSNGTDSTSPTTGALTITGGVGIGKSLFVNGTGTFLGGIAATGTISGPGVVVSTVATNTISISGSGISNTALNINGGNATIDKLGNIIGIGKLTMGALSSLNGGITVNGGNFSVDTLGNTVVKGTLNVTGLSTMNGMKLLSDLTTTSGNFTLTQSNGNVSTNGTMTVGGLFTGNNVTTTVGNLSISSFGNITLNNKSVINAIIDDTTNTVAANKLFNGAVWKVLMNGAVPIAGQVLTADGLGNATWTSLTGNVVGAGSSTANDIVKFANTTGKLLADTGIQIDGNSNLNIPNSTSTSNNIDKGGSLFITNIGTNNTGLGVGALNLTLNTVSATDNVAIGTSAMNAISTSAKTVAIGSFAYNGETTQPSSDVAVGYNTLNVNTNGNNVAIGLNTVATSTGTISNTVAIGSAALVEITGVVNNIVAVGSGALNILISGSQNTCIGTGTMNLLLTGSNNVGISGLAGNSYTGAESNNICILAAGTTGESNVIHVGGSQNKMFVAGVRGVTTGNADAIQLLIDSAGQFGTVSSSIKYKDNVYDMKNITNNLMNMRPVTFTYKEDKNKKTQFGLIAEEVNEIYPELVVNNKEGQIYSVQYHTLIPMLLNELQRQNGMIENQNEEIRSLELLVK